MSYASLDEAFPSVNLAATTSSGNWMPGQMEDVGTPLKKNKNKKRSSRSMPEPAVIEPDRPGARPVADVEILRGSPNENVKSTSLSNYLVAADDPSEDYFPYPLGADADKSEYMLQPDWTQQIYNKGIGHHSETPIAPPTPVDGYSTLWRNIPNPMNDDEYNQRKRTDATDTSVKDDLREKVDRILQRLDSQEYKLAGAKDTFSEILLFIFIGVIIILMLDLFFRAQQYAIAHLLTTSMRQTGGAMGYRKKNGLSSMMRKLKIAGFI